MRSVDPNTMASESSVKILSTFPVAFKCASSASASPGAYGERQNKFVEQMNETLPDDSETHTSSLFAGIPESDDGQL